MEDFFDAGGVPAMMYELRDRLDLSAGTVHGVTVGDWLGGSGTRRRDVLAPVDSPLRMTGAIRVVRGNLAPRGAVVKVTAGTEALLRHVGPAVVFDGLEDLERRIDDPSVDIRADSVLILRGLGPVGAPGMPEKGHIPIPARLLKAGVTDMVRISDARMSGTAYGTCVLHVTPESAIGGALGLVRDGDLVRLEAEAGVLEVLVPDEELMSRVAVKQRNDRGDVSRGYRRLYLEHVLQADEGCDFDFLRAGNTSPSDP
jgi:dihydroxy-acid dehydratase